MVWKIWAYNAATIGVTQVYGVGGQPPERRLLEYRGRYATVDYPPIALYELAVVGHLVLAAWAWGLWKARGVTDPFLLAGLAAFLVHAYFVLAVQVHENHLFLAVPLLALAAAGRQAFRPILLLVSVVVALNLNLFYGISEGVGYGLPRSITIVDASVVLALANVAALVWHGRVLKAACRGVSANPIPCYRIGRAQRERP